MSIASFNAEFLYSEVQSRGQWSRLWSLLTGGSARLADLAEVAEARSVCARHATKVQSVPIAQIQGSEGRSHDFDRNFYPMQNRCKARWISIAMAWEQGKILPLVELIQVGDEYFVRDGHHRISVARALGVKEIEAEVTVWAV